MGGGECLILLQLDMQCFVDTMGDLLLLKEMEEEWIVGWEQRELIGYLEERREGNLCPRCKISK